VDNCLAGTLSANKVSHPLRALLILLLPIAIYFKSNFFRMHLDLLFSLPSLLVLISYSSLNISFDGYTAVLSVLQRYYMTVFNFHIFLLLTFVW